MVQWDLSWIRRYSYIYGPILGLCFYIQVLDKNMSMISFQKTVTLPSLPPENSDNDWIGPPDKVSNIRQMKFSIPVNETSTERQFREKREALQKWHHQHWTKHNKSFFQVRLCVLLFQLWPISFIFLKTFFEIKQHTTMPVYKVVIVLFSTNVTFYQYVQILYNIIMQIRQLMQTRLSLLTCNCKMCGISMNVIN